MSSLALIQAAMLLCAFSAAFALACAVASAPSSPPNLLGIRGLKRVRALSSSSLFADIEPAMRFCGIQVRRLLGAQGLAATDRQLMLAGDFLGLLPEEFIALCLLAGGAGAAALGVHAFLSEASLGYAMLGGLLGALVPHSRLSSLEEQRRRQVDHGLPPLIDLLVLGLSAGLDLPGAVRQVVQMSGNPGDPLIEELGFVLHELNVGKTRKTALTQLAERLPSAPVREFTAAVIQAEEHGNPLARVLAIHAEVSRQQRSTRAEELAAKAGVKMLMPMMMVFVAILLLIVGPTLLAAGATF